MRRVLLILLLLPLFCGRAWAEEPLSRALEIFDAEAMQSGLSGEERAIGESLGPDASGTATALSRLWQDFCGKLRESLRAEFGFAVSLLALVFLSGLARSACAEGRIGGLIEICAVCSAAAVLIGDVTGLAEETTRALFRLSDYSKAALPVVYTAAAASGAVSSSAVRYASAVLALDVMMTLAQRAVIPLICASLSLTLTNAVFPNAILIAAEKLAQWAAKTAMRAVCLAFTAYLGVASVLSTGVDAAAIKAARSILSGAVPVVGGMISDASSAVLSAAAVVRSFTGAVGLVSVCAMCAGPFALLTVKNLLFKSVAAVAESVKNPRLQKLFAGIGSAVSLLMGLLGSCAVMLFLSLALGMKAVTA